jgi:2,3-bisphosphoglycerate-dependent phosphoglycerate mutase
MKGGNQSLNTQIYMIRHGDSPKEGPERTRGLTKKGIADAQKVTELLKKENMDVVVSSPYLRSVQTVEGISQHIGQSVIVEEDLKERIFSTNNNRISDQELGPLLEESFRDPDFALEGAESNAECQRRAVAVLDKLLHTYKGKNIAVGTHGAVMTLMMNHYDSRFDLKFLYSTSKPDIYRMEFKGLELVGVHRLWTEAERVTI